VRRTGQFCALRLLEFAVASCLTTAVPLAVKNSGLSPLSCCANHHLAVNLRALESVECSVSPELVSQSTLSPVVKMDALVICLRVKNDSMVLPGTFTYGYVDVFMWLRNLHPTA
jgi:hypothetical protein